MLFSSNDVVLHGNPEWNTKAAALPIHSEFTFLEGDKLQHLNKNIGALTKDHSIYFKTDGAWSSIDLIEYCLEQTGPAEIFLSTWSIGPDALRRFNEWISSGVITCIHAIIDEGFRNRKPDLFQQACAVFPLLKFSKSHAKVTVIRGAAQSITLMGSANLTKNHRTEVGILILDKALAEANIKWISETIINGS